MIKDTHVNAVYLKLYIILFICVFKIKKKTILNSLNYDDY